VTSQNAPAEAGLTPEEQASLRGFGLSRRPGERWTRFAARIANAYGVVLLLVVLTYMLASLTTYSGWTGALIAAAASASATVALVSSEARPKLVHGAIGVAVGAVTCAAVSAITGGSTALAISALLIVSLLLVAVAETLAMVLSERNVGFRTILGAISVYVILGLLFTFLYAAIDRLQAGPFFGTETDTGDFIFFSITTLTTTGYGNLVPAAQPGKMFAGLEMLIGQIFLVTLIAGLVSLWRPGLARRRNASAG
jgi:hypothetical protein